MAELPKLISTVPGTTPEVVALLETQAKEAAADAKVLQAEVQASLEKFLQTLATNSVIDEKDPIKQLAGANPAIANYVAALQESIFQAKSSSAQGLLLAQQLQAGSITQAQFASSVNAIEIPTSQLQAAVSGVLPAQTQQLILTLASNSALTGPALLDGSSVGETEPKAAATVALLDGAEAGETSAKDPPTQSSLSATSVPKSAPNLTELNDGFSLTVPPAIPGVSVLEIEYPPPPLGTVPPLLQTEQTDQKLGNNTDWLTNILNVAAKIAEQNLKASASALISLHPQPRIMTGARAVVRLNNKVVTLCNNVQYEINTDWQEIRGIDELIPNDLAPSVFAVSGSMSIYRVPNGSPVDDFLQQDMFRGMIWPYVSIEIRDKRTDELIMSVRRAAITRRSESYAKNQLTSMMLSFTGIGFRDEAMPKLLPDTLPNSQTSGGLLGAISNVIGAIGSTFGF
jgi:hypothetical protein